MRIFLPQDTLGVIDKQYIFVDTSFLIDFAFLQRRDRNSFFDSWEEIKMRAALLTTFPVATEFLLGSSEKDLIKKKEYLAELVGTVINSRLIQPETIEEIIIEYGRYAQGKLSYVDLSLGAAVKQFDNSLVLTRNYEDFPLKIFDCQAIFGFHLNKSLRMYGFYSYKGLGSSKENNEDRIRPPF